MTRYIDATPTWAGIMPALLAAIADGTPAAQDAARAEIMRLARQMDAQIAREKAAQAGPTSTEGA